MKQNKNILLKTINPLLILEGKWSGNGIGVFPTIDSIRYREETNFSVIENEPYIQFDQKAWVIDSKEDYLIHWETGIISAVSEGKLKLYTCHMNGRVEIASGVCNPDSSFHEVVFISEYIKNEKGLKNAINSRRVLSFQDNELEYSMSMSTSEVTSSKNHLKAKLRRVK